MSKVYFDRNELERTIKAMKPDGELFEIRIIRGKEIYSGYFNETATLIEALKRQQLEQCNVYITLQRLHEGCSARLQWNEFIKTGGTPKIVTTSDNDVINYSFIPVDLDPIRPAEISSTEEELKDAESLAEQIIEYMSAQGFNDYIYAFSGNGYHLLFKTEVFNDEEGEDYIKKYLNRLDELFSNEACHVDVVNYNPGRIFKLYGTLAQKGRSTQERPHRMSHIIEVHHEEAD